MAAANGSSIDAWIASIGGTPVGWGVMTDHIRQPGPSTTVAPPLGRRTTRTPAVSQT